MRLEDGVFDYGKGLRDLYIVLNEETDGLIKQILERDALEHYDGLGDLVTILECFEDDVHRVWNLVEFHDVLAEADDDDWNFFLSQDPNDLELRFKESDWLLRLKERIKVELMLRKLRNEDCDEDEDDVIVEFDMEKLLLSFCDFLLESVPSLDFLEKDNAKRLQLIEDFLEEWGGKNE